jgi:hypothetical protein
MRAGSFCIIVANIGENGKRQKNLDERQAAFGDAPWAYSVRRFFTGLLNAAATALMLTVTSVSNSVRRPANRNT